MQTFYWFVSFLFYNHFPVVGLLINDFTIQGSFKPFHLYLKLKVRRCARPPWSVLHNYRRSSFGTGIYHRTFNRSSVPEPEGNTPVIKHSY